VEALIAQYHLPVSFEIDKEKAWDILLHDKKKSGTEMNFIVLDKIGKASVKKIPLSELKELFYSLS
jgi:3-dehydroquinate synthase